LNVQSPPSPIVSPTRIIMHLYKKRFFPQPLLNWSVLSALSKPEEEGARSWNSVGGACNCYENQNMYRWSLMGGVIETSNSSAWIADSELQEGENWCKEWGSVTVGRLMQARGSTDTPLTPLSLASRESDGREQWVSKTVRKSVKMAWLAWCECGGKIVCLVTSWHFTNKKRTGKKELSRLALTSDKRVFLWLLLGLI
jgi:hypothetical protein